MIDLKSMSLNELEAHKAEVEKLIKGYHDTRKAKLVGTIISATKQLLEAYPYSSCDMEVCCPDCDGCFDINILEYLSRASTRDFDIC
jgi:hypothetical protein